MPSPAHSAHSAHLARGARLVSADGRALPLTAVALDARAGAGLARVELRQQFRNPHPEPLTVLYTFPLPPGAATAGYEIRLGDRVIRGEVDRRAAARERFDRALLDGRTAGLLDQERPNLFTQRIGNVPPGAEVTVVLTLDQPLDWVDAGWEWRFPTVVAPRYVGGAGRVPDAERVAIDVADGDTGVRASFALTIDDDVVGGAPTCGSHDVQVAGGRVRGADARLDRDLVVRWPVAAPEPGATLRVARPADGAPHADAAYGLLTVVPPAAVDEPFARDLIVLIDASGSMSGAPMRHAQATVLALVDSLAPEDRLELIAFATGATRWRTRPAAATPRAKQAASDWVRALEASGGTEMGDAIEGALAPLRPGARRQVILVTDGLIGFESDAISTIRGRLPETSRLCAVGVGPATNQGFLRVAARAGRGVQVHVDLDDAPTAAAARIVAATRAPALVDLVVEGDALIESAPENLADVTAGAPVQVALKLQPSGGEIVVRGRTPAGAWRRGVSFDPVAAGAGDPAVVRRFGRETVEDLELDLADGVPADEIDPMVEEVGLTFGIATRLTSWIAVDTRPSVDPREPARVERVPQELAFMMSAEGLGLRATQEPFHFARVARGRLNLTLGQELSDAPDELASLCTILEEPPRRHTHLAAHGHVLSGGPSEVIVIEFEASEPFEMPDQFRIDLFDRNGKLGGVDAVESFTTRPGRVREGSLVRLALRRADVRPGTSRVLLLADRVTIEIRIAPGEFA